MTIKNLIGPLYNWLLLGPDYALADITGALHPGDRVVLLQPDVDMSVPGNVSAHCLE